MIFMSYVNVFLYTQEKKTQKKFIRKCVFHSKNVAFYVFFTKKHMISKFYTSSEQDKKTHIHTHIHTHKWQLILLGNITLTHIPTIT